MGEGLFDHKPLQKHSLEWGSKRCIFLLPQAGGLANNVSQDSASQADLSGHVSTQARRRQDYKMGFLDWQY